MSKKLVRLIDWRILPVLVLLFLLNILDRSNIASAKVSGMPKDLGFGPVTYNNAVLVLFIGYVAMQIPAGFILAKIPPVLFLTGAVTTWGVVSMCCGFVKTAPQLLALRFLVGVAEAPFFPGALLILSSFYTRKELAVRIAIMYSGNSLSNSFGGLIAAGLVSGLEGKGGLEGWRWLFIVEGAITVFVGIAVYFILPSYPSKTKFFSEEQRRLAVWRTTQDANGEPDEGGETSLVKGAKLVIKDWKILMLIFQQMFISCSQSFSYFFPSIVKSLGYDRNKTLLLTAPPYLFAFFASLGVAVSSSKLEERGLHIAIPMLISTLGNILVIALPDTNIAGRYTAMFMLTMGSYCAFNLSFSWLTATIPRPRIKRAAALSLVNGLANARMPLSPYFFLDSDAPKYINGGSTIAAFSFAVAAGAISIKFVLKWQNRVLDRLDEEDKPYEGSLEGIPKGYRFIT
ncbi:hypothetical protein FFLO_04119 [Filobasidium floriforme]|uniref:Major facilitator superfamily (MFS) profile domain-containing protein n=1 Tax=Filobasidium floriforme TaxID=5210 RepID=A0A8K0NPJ9_9TREE|nr:hypothetical protein FFLO_04119 [Filobasidium floriforme]